MNGDAEVVTLTDDGHDARDATPRSASASTACAAGCASSGWSDGDRVATFAWNTQHHLEVYLAAPCMGAVLHTLNIRLFPEQLVYIVNHAQDKVILVDGSLVDAARAARRPVRDRRALRRDGRRRPRRAARTRSATRSCSRARSRASTTRRSTTARRPGSATRAARPATRRASSTRTARTSCTRWASVHGRRGRALARDRILPVVPMFHANAWGLPYAACMAGASLIMPGRFLQAEPLARLIEARAGHGGRRGADDLARRPALVGRAQARPARAPDRGLRRRGRAAQRSWRRSRSATACASSRRGA